jgi:phospholipid/cholesterol/gamma-HCH transport system substrate-binding protein
VSELLAGGVVLAVALGFLGYAVANTGRTGVAGITLHAQFDHIDGLGIGADVRLAGVKVGSVSEARVDPESFQAVVTFSLAKNIKLPMDSSAQITSDGLLGGKFVSLVPGGDTRMFADGGMMTITQSAASLEDLLGKFIFNVGNLTGAVEKSLKQGAAKP